MNRPEFYRPSQYPPLVVQRPRRRLAQVGHSHQQTTYSVLAAASDGPRGSFGWSCTASETLTHERRIAAILAADVVDYSRLMGVDEESTLVALKLRRSSFDQLVAAYGGHEFGSVGDSLMAHFPSAVNAVRCAQAIQRRTEQDNASLRPDRRMHLRIGVNLGDVIEENGIAFGDAVNIAARLQSHAKPGGLLISGPVYDQVRSKFPARFVDAGARHVKNVAEPVRMFEVLLAEPSGVGEKLSMTSAYAAWVRVRRLVGAVAALGTAVALGFFCHGLSVANTARCLGSVDRSESAIAVERLTMLPDARFASEKT